MNEKGFILIDSLICLIIVSAISSLTLLLFFNYDSFIEGYKDYQEEVANRYSAIYDSLEECEKCVIQEDLSPQDS